MDNTEIVILGDADSLWTKRCIEHIFGMLKGKVSIISTKNTRYCDFYQKKNVNVYTTYNEQIYKRWPHLGLTVHYMRLLRLVINNKEKVIVVQYVDPDKTIFLSKFVSGKNLILTYWGSDLLRTNEKKLYGYKKLVLNSRNIVVMTDEMKAKLLGVYGNKVEKKTHVIDMGISAFKDIDNALEIRNQNKILDSSRKITVTIGYNASKGQQQDRVLKCIGGINEKYKDKIRFIIPMTYPRTDIEYMNEVICCADMCGIEYEVLNEFLDDRGIGELCAKTDIFINAQITDAMSSSVLEQLYSGTILLNASWLKYGFLDKLGVKYYSFDSFGDLNNQLMYLIDNMDTIDVTMNHDLLKEQCSWEKCFTEWRKVLSK